MLYKKDILTTLKTIGFEDGNILVVQSSYKGCGGIEDGPNGLIETLIKNIGPNSTIIMPAYNFTSWTESHYFDTRETPGQVGIICETFRKRNDVIRTVHPIHSFSVWGKYSQELSNMDYHNSFGLDSVFSFLLQKDAIYFTLGLGSKMPFLQCHYTENICQVSYRRVKDFGGIYVTSSRNCELRVYGFPVRVNNKQPVFLAHEELIKEEKVNSLFLNRIPICYARAKDYHDDFAYYIKNNFDYFDL